jgi:eukaryotic-like serine/threonine-protein kinase
MIGKTLGHYQITNQIRKGNRGEVLQAKDQIPGRDVAIKVLPEEFAPNAACAARFQRKARLLAYPDHITAICGLEESVGTAFLHVESVECETTADRSKRGAISIGKSRDLTALTAGEDTK